AGGTISLGLPLGRMDKVPEAARSFLATVSAGIPLLLFGDVVHEGWGLVGEAGAHDKDGGPPGAAIVRAAVFLGAFALGVFGRAFFALAAGAMLFVVGELWTAASRRASRNLVLTGIVVGFLLGIGTDLILEIAGG